MFWVCVIVSTDMDYDFQFPMVALTYCETKRTLIAFSTFIPTTKKSASFTSKYFWYFDIYTYKMPLSTFSILIYTHSLPVSIISVLENCADSTWVVSVLKSIYIHYL